jgi:hypothetical protein
MRTAQSASNAEKSGVKAAKRRQPAAANHSWYIAAKVFVLVALLQWLPDTGFGQLADDARQRLLDSSGLIANEDNFMLAAREGDTNKIGLFLLAGLDANTPGVLAEAARSTNAQAVQLLIDKGANINTENGRRALRWACAEGHAETVKLLIANGAGVDSADDNGVTPLICAASRAAAKPRPGATPGTMIPADSKQDADIVEVVKLLLESHADPAIKDNSGSTALDYARKNGRTDLIELLKPVTPGSAEIEGAFGFKLGEVFDLSKGQRVTSKEYEFTRLDNMDLVATREYEVVPDKPLAGFTNYRVTIAPLSHRIYFIQALGPQSALEDQCPVIATALAGKYGGEPSQKYGWYHRKVGDRSIELNHFTYYTTPNDPAPKNLVYLRYRDEGLEHVLRQELKELQKSEQDAEQNELDSKAKALDKSGL